MKYAIVPVEKIDQGHGHWHYAVSGAAVKLEDVPGLKDALTRELCYIGGCKLCEEKINNLLL